MPDLNKVMVIGNLTRDPEVRYTPKGTAVGELGLAINSTAKGSDGTTKEETTFLDVVVWGRQAETAKEYLVKGRPVFIEGRLQLDQWEGKDGEKKSRLRVVAERIQFLGGRPEGGEKQQERRPRDNRMTTESHAQTGTTEDEDSIPF